MHSLPSKARRKLSPGPFVVTTEDRVLDVNDSWDDLAARIEDVPRHAEIRGMFLSEVLRLEPSLQSPRARYIPFSMYPVHEYMELLLTAAQTREPNKSPGGALLALGLGVYSLFASSLTGLAIFSIAQNNFARVSELSSKAYGITLKPGRATAVSVEPNEALIQLRDVWVFPDIFHCGIWLGAMQASNARGTIDVIRHSLCDVDFRVRWQQS